MEDHVYVFLLTRLGNFLYIWYGDEIYHKLNKEICKNNSYSRHVAIPVECSFLPCRW